MSDWRPAIAGLNGTGGTKMTLDKVLPEAGNYKRGTLRALAALMRSWSWVAIGTPKR
jgi:hypothetical protein